MASHAQIRKKLMQYALDFPEAYEDHPWGEDVAKVNKKVFVFFGVPEPSTFGLSVKLPDAREFAMTFPFSEPTGYGLGKAGWITAHFTKGDDIPVDMLMDWVDESYRAVAPKRLVKQLDAEAP
jgi:predicted DNA-binding protein (MmcQ/YjbR family)